METTEDSLFKEIQTSLNFKGLNFNSKVFTLVKDATQKEIDSFVCKINCQHGKLYNAEKIKETFLNPVSNNSILFMGDIGPRPFNGISCLHKDLVLLSHARPLEGLSWPKGTTFLVIEKRS